MAISRASVGTSQPDLISVGYITNQLGKYAPHWMGLWNVCLFEETNQNQSSA